jgi:hypothetical protein
VVALDKPPSKSAGAKAVATTGAIDNGDTWVDHIEGKEEEKVEHKKKEPVFTRGVELINLDDCKVPNMRLYCNSNDTYDDEAPNLGDMDVSEGATLCL